MEMEIGRKMNPYNNWADNCKKSITSESIPFQKNKAGCFSLFFTISKSKFA